MKQAPSLQKLYFPVGVGHLLVEKGVGSGYSGGGVMAKLVVQVERR